ncbi:fimbria/pilus periplasmic chaperone [Escherichia coli]|nr:fimbria/pilus periplasmic chaperone [Escherichia coli]ELT2927404.1 fimbria/pilus periplasmic chaperone [Escherichia coli]
MNSKAFALLLGVFTGLSSVSAVAVEDKNMDVASKVFSLYLGESRVIYNPALSGATLTVINKQNYPMLIQSEVLAENKKDKASFIVTPPLFRLDAHQSSRLRIIRTGGVFPEDRETLQWICVKGIPPKEDDKWAGSKNGDNKKSSSISLQVQFIVNSCIKLFVRPTAVKGYPDDVAGSVEWNKIDNKLTAYNPTPFYINLAELSVGDKKMNVRNYISPYSSYEYDFPVGASGKVRWKIITDHGGKSEEFTSELKITAITEQ